MFYNRFLVELEIFDSNAITYKIADILADECFTLAIPINAMSITVIENILIEKISDKRDKKINQIIND